MGAFIKIPFPYVPLTLQTFFVLLAGNILGAQLGALSQIIYLCIGLIGLPIFAYGGGFGYILQPTFGYLVAYPGGSFIAGLIIRSLFKNNRIKKIKQNFLFIKICLANFLSILFIYLIGVTYLYLNLNLLIKKSISFDQALWAGFFIFLPGDILKVILASSITIKLKKYIR